MKKTALLAVIVCLSLLTACLTTHAQLANTKWKGVINIPMENGSLQPFAVTWLFGMDTVRLIYDNASMESDVMTYKESKGTIAFKKVSGGAPCDSSAVLSCTYEIKNDQLSFKRISDACEARSHADASQPLDRIK